MDGYGYDSTELNALLSKATNEWQHAIRNIVNKILGSRRKQIVQDEKTKKWMFSDVDTRHEVEHGDVDIDAMFKHATIASTVNDILHLIGSHLEVYLDESSQKWSVKDKNEAVYGGDIAYGNDTSDDNATNFIEGRGQGDKGEPTDHDVKTDRNHAEVRGQGESEPDTNDLKTAEIEFQTSTLSEKGTGGKEPRVTKTAEIEFPTSTCSEKGTGGKEPRVTKTAEIEFPTTTSSEKGKEGGKESRVTKSGRKRPAQGEIQIPPEKEMEGPLTKRRIGRERQDEAVARQDNPTSTSSEKGTSTSSEKGTSTNSEEGTGGKEARVTKRRRKRPAQCEIQIPLEKEMEGPVTKRRIGRAKATGQDEAVARQDKEMSQGKEITEKRTLDDDKRDPVVDNVETADIELALSEGNERTKKRTLDDDKRDPDANADTVHTAEIEFPTSNRRLSSGMRDIPIEFCIGLEYLKDGERELSFGDVREIPIELGYLKNGKVRKEERKRTKDHLMDKWLECGVPKEGMIFEHEMPGWTLLEGVAHNDLFRCTKAEKRKWIIDSGLFTYHLCPMLPEDRAPTEEEKAEHSRKLQENKDLETKIQKDKKSFDNYLKVSAWSLSTLRPGEWISDEVINCYGQLIYNRELKLKGKQECRFLIIDTMFYQAAQDTLSERMDVVSDWPCFYANHSAVERGAKFENREYIIFPVCNNKHFMLLIFNVPKWELLILDSLSDSDFQRHAAHFVITAVKSFLYLRASHLLKRHEPVACYVPKNIPRQMNTYDCGAYLVLFLDSFTQGRDLRGMQWSETDLENTRWRLITELLEGKFYVELEN